MGEQILNQISNDKIVTLEEAREVYYDLREQAKDIPEMSLEEINAEIAAVRTERNIGKKK